MDPLIPTDLYIAVPEPRNVGVTGPVIATLNPPQNSLDTKKINVARGPDTLGGPHAKRTHPVARTTARPTGDTWVISEKGPRLRNASRLLPSPSTLSAQSVVVWVCCDLPNDATLVD